MEKYGFIYLWYDRKHKRYYLGKHWGHEKDNYVCSSKWMKRSYKRRKDDFHRKILERVYTSKKDLGEAEYRWGSLIKKEELGKKYYNLKIPKDRHWHDDPHTSKTVKERISVGLEALGPEHKAKMSQLQKDLWADPEHRKNRTEKVSQGQRARFASDPTLGKAHTKRLNDHFADPIASAISRQMMSKRKKGRKWYFNPQTGKSRQFFLCDVPNEWKAGRRQR